MSILKRTKELKGSHWTITPFGMSKIRPSTDEYGMARVSWAHSIKNSGSTAKRYLKENLLKLWVRFKVYLKLKIALKIPNVKCTLPVLACVKSFNLIHTCFHSQWNDNFINWHEECLRMRCILKLSSGLREIIWWAVI